jgi:hypothetical protein
MRDFLEVVNRRRIRKGKRVLIVEVTILKHRLFIDEEAAQRLSEYIVNCS